VRIPVSVGRTLLAVDVAVREAGPIRSHSEDLVAIAGSRQPNSMSNPLMS
jgi:hypothetical protein